jgi:hypothetical protein
LEELRLENARECSSLQCEIDELKTTLALAEESKEVKRLELTIFDGAGSLGNGNCNRASSLWWGLVHLEEASDSVETE